MLRRAGLGAGLLWGLWGAAALRALWLPAPAWPVAHAPRLVGSYHVHSAHSHDSSVAPEAWAEAARHQRLNFVLLTDHDAQLAAPQQHAGVWLLPNTELNTADGHLVALGLGAAVPAEVRRGAGVVDYVRQQGGLAVAAHPTSRKRPYSGSLAKLHGLEPQNLSTVLFQRLHGPALLPTLLQASLWPVQPRLVLAQLYAADAEAAALWDALPPPALGLCGTDAHGWVRLRDNLAAWHLVLDDLPQDAEASAAVVLDALRRGHFHSVAGLYGREAGFAFCAYAAGARVACEGDHHAGAPDVLRACVGPLDGGTQPVATASDAGRRGAPPAPWQLVLYRNGQQVAGGTGCVVLEHPPAGHYRVEARTPLPHWLWGQQPPRPVLYSNRLTLTATAPS